MNGKPGGRRARALALLESLEAGAPDRVTANLDDFHPDAVELLLGFAFTDVVSRQGMDLKVREMLTVAMLGAMGTAPGQLEFHMGAALNTGVSKEELTEIVFQVAVYGGIPAAINAITAAKAALRSSRQQG